MIKTIHFVRHGQAEHNVTGDETILDAKLTKLGQEQSRALHDRTQANLQLTADFLVCSPQVRALETMILGLPELKHRLVAEGIPVVVLDILQEMQMIPCDTPTYPPSANLAAQGGIFADLDLSGLSEQYASKQGIFHIDNVNERAQLVRDWLFSRPEQEIVVVGHGKFLAEIVEMDFDTYWWANTEVRAFRFQEGTGSRALVGVTEIKPVRAPV